MKIDLGYLGTVDLEEFENYHWQEEGFAVVSDGYTPCGIRVHGVIDNDAWNAYPTIWNSAILIKIN